MKIRPALLHVMLALLLLVSQQMGVAHAVSHFFDGRPDTSQDKRLPSEKVCDQCLAFAQFGSALTNPPFVFFADAADNAAPLAAANQNLSPESFHGFHSRAPPTSA